ncbi:MAG: hypothetical protein HOW73_28090 [Polyangiaceae bacterium]|nr:hypothetical protein [Polyangiaceae bacterium]
MTPIPAAGPAVAREARAPDAVEVLLDREPDKPFVVMGQLQARAIESPKSIEMMREEAARAGFDGIYWIDCETPRRGRCTAKGYVYAKPIEPKGAETIAKK